jgi:hypothetical protein
MIVITVKNLIFNVFWTIFDLLKLIKFRYKLVLEKFKLVKCYLRGVSH